MALKDIGDSPYFMIGGVVVIAALIELGIELQDRGVLEEYAFLMFLFAVVIIMLDTTYMYVGYHAAIREFKKRYQELKELFKK